MVDSPQVLILGGCGRIGQCVAQDIVTFTNAQVTVTGRHVPTHLEGLDAYRCLVLDLNDSAALNRAIASSHLVIHCAGPFHHRDDAVLLACIRNGVNYIDVSDSRAFTERMLAQRSAAADAGITAVINTGIFPGISNSMVRLGVEALEQVEEIHLSYVVGGSGGAGLTVLKTTFLGILNPFTAWIDGAWTTVQPYSDRQSVEFLPPYRSAAVYWYEMPETLTLAQSFPARTVTTKFGSIPDVYNHLTWFTARFLPKSWLKQPKTIDLLAEVSQRMTAVSDRFSGIGVGVRADVVGYRKGQRVVESICLNHPNTAIAAGYGAGSVAQVILSGELHQPGVWPVEQALSSDLFERTMQQRQVAVTRHR